MRRCTILATILAISTSAALADAANNAVRFGAGWIDPNGETTVNSGGTDVNLNADSTTAYFLDYERRLVPWLGLGWRF